MLSLFKFLDLIVKPEIIGIENSQNLSFSKKELMS